MVDRGRGDWVDNGVLILPLLPFFCISQVMIDSSRLQRPSASYTTAESVKWGGGGGAVCICGAGCLDLVVRTLAWVCLFCQAAIFRCLHTLCASVHIGTALRPAAICFQLECFWKSPCSCVFSSKTLIRHQREFPGLVFKLPCSGDCTKATLTQPLKLLCHKGDITMKCWWHHNAISIDSLEELDPE